MATETRVENYPAKRFNIYETTGILNNLVENRGWVINQGWFSPKTREEEKEDPEYAHLRKVSLKRVDELNIHGSFLISNPFDIGEGFNSRYFICLDPEMDAAGAFLARITKLAPETPNKKLVSLEWEDMLEEIRLDGIGNRGDGDLLEIASKEANSDEFMTEVLNSLKA